MSKHTQITECRCCGTDVQEYLNLGDQPLANSYHLENETLDTYPLRLTVCPSCFHNQLSVVVDPDEMFKNYLYVSGTTTTLHEYFDKFAQHTLSRRRATTFSESHFTPQEGSHDNKTAVLDIACNDGTQLIYYKKQGCDVWGVDPAENLSDLARHNGVNLKVGYWNSQLADELLSEVGRPFDIITAQNVFAHTHDVLEFLLACKSVMHDTTDLYIQTSQARMFDENQFDTAYHEHLSFFNTKSMKTIVERAGLFLNDVQIEPIHGDSYVFRINKVANTSNNVDETMDNEFARGLYSINTYTKFAQSAQTVVKDLTAMLHLFRMGGYTIVGYGAAAKGMTVLNFAGIDAGLFSYIIDDNPLKVGRLTPGSNIEIRPASALDNETGKLVIVPLAWNFFDEISARVRSRVSSTDVLYVRYFPKLHITK